MCLSGALFTTVDVSGCAVTLIPCSSGKAELRGEKMGRNIQILGPNIASATYFKKVND